MQHTQPLNLDAITIRASRIHTHTPQADEPDEITETDIDQLAGTDVPALIAELRRTRVELAAAQSQAIAWAADQVDAKLTAEPDHNRASALYELLLHLRGELSCTCARTGGLHAKDCRKYVPGHELLSRHNALARYRVEPAAARPAAPTT